MTDYDSIVIGAGMGGMCAAARLAAAGHKVLLARSRHIWAAGAPTATGRLPGDHRRDDGGACRSHRDAGRYDTPPRVLPGHSDAEGAVTGVVLNTAEARTQQLTSTYVLSNAGPVRTMELAGGRDLYRQYDDGYLAELDSWPHEAPIFHISFATDAPLIDGFDGCFVFGNDRNLIYLEVSVADLARPDAARQVPAHGLRCANRRRETGPGGGARKHAQGTTGELPRPARRCGVSGAGEACGPGPGMHRWGRPA